MRLDLLKDGADRMGDRPAVSRERSIKEDEESAPAGPVENRSTGANEVKNGVESQLPGSRLGENPTG